MIKVKIPNNNISEREYILEIILKEFLGISYTIEMIDDTSDVWELTFSNNNSIIIEDHFFNKFKKDLDYLDEKNIPITVSFQQKTKNRYLFENNIPILYGNDSLDISTQNQKIITCGIDIFASSFFMLTRWEEYTNKSRDKLERFIASNSLAYKASFLHRPIVNEYVEMLWNMIKELDDSLNRKERVFEIHPTHDVDIPFYWQSYKFFIRRIGGDILKRKSLSAFFSSCKNYMNTKLLGKKDPADSFDFLMDLSEELGSKSYFYFMAKGTSIFDNYYKSDDKRVLDIVKRVKDRNHHIGIHPTFNSYNDYDQLKGEIEELEKNYDVSIKFGRHHILRFGAPITWSIWDKNGLEWDSTLSYADYEGFRCGVCYEYSVFDFLDRKKLKLKERPLAAMEETLIKTRKLSPKEYIEKNLELAEIIKKYNGLFIILYHNDSFIKDGWEEYKDSYRELILKLKEYYVK